MAKRKQKDSYRPTLLVSVLRRKPQDQPKFGKRQRSFWYKTKQRVFILLLMGAVGYLVFWLQTRKPTTQNAESIATVEAVDASAVLDHRDELSTTDLIYLAREMDLNPDAALPVQMQWIDDRIDISNQLLEKSDEELAQKEGTLYRMEALQLLSNLNRKYKLGESTVDAQLYELCESNLNHNDPEVSKIAAVVVMMSALHQFSTDPSLINLQDALNKCEQITSQLNEDHEIALAIFKYAKLMQRSDVMIDDSVEFYKVIVDQYLDSKSEKASVIATNAFREILYGDQSGEKQFSALLMAGIKDRFRQNRKSIESEITNRIVYSLNEELLDEQGVQQIVTLLEILLTKDRINLASDISDQVHKFLSSGAGSKIEGAVAKLDDYKKRLSLYQSEFSLDGVMHVGGAEIENSEQPILLVYWLPSDALSTRLLNSLKRLSVGNVVQCIVISENLSEDELAQTKLLAKSIPEFSFTNVDLNSELGAEFRAQFPVPRLPYLVLLDSQRQVMGINLDVRDLGKKLQTIQ